MVNRIMIKNVILFKINGVIYKIVIHGIISHNNIGVGNDIFQIYGFTVF